MSSVVTKNPFDLLGNDEDSDSSPAPVKTVEKTSTHTTKRNAGDEAPSRAPVPGSSRRGGSYGGNEGAFRDRNAGSDRNRSKTTDEVRGGVARGGRGARGRGGRGGGFPRDRDDRHARNNIASTTDKAAAQGWGSIEGGADDLAGEEIAKKDAAAEAAEVPEVAEVEQEPEDRSLTLDQYKALQAEKKLALSAAGLKTLEARRPNEGVAENKKWANAKAITKDDDQADYFAGTGGKAKRERERKVKQLIEIGSYSRGDGSRGRGDGARGRGGRGRGDGARGRGEGGRGRGGPRGEFRGGRGGRTENQSLNTNDESAFPTLGS